MKIILLLFHCKSPLFKISVKHLTKKYSSNQEVEHGGLVLNHESSYNPNVLLLKEIEF